MGVHTGKPVIIDDSYVGIDVHRAARICSAAHGGQVIVSGTTLELVKGRNGVEFKDLGVHRLKDLHEPEQIAQVVVPDLPQRFPPLRSLPAPTNVPKHLGALVGRQRERSELHDLLVDEDIRLITVTGPGGTGKTRLSSAVALDALPFFTGGVFFVDVTPVTTSELLATVISETLDTPLTGDRPAVNEIIDHIGSRHMLLMLDNFEQAVAAADVVAKLLRGCPQLNILTTTRIPLSLSGEHEYSLNPLLLPTASTPEAVRTSEAAQLFAARAASVTPNFEITDTNASAVAEVCRLLDGLPLALELAAARLKLLPLDALLARLADRLKLLTSGASDLPERQRTLRATIDWSHDLLTGDEQEFFRSMAVFNGGATPEAIDTVISPAIDAIDALSSLVNHSLIRRHESGDADYRFAMLQTIRDYALELLTKAPELHTLRDRHARYYLEVVERQRQENIDRDPAMVGRELDNLRAALGWFASRADAGSKEDAQALLRLAGLLGRHWYTHAMVHEGTRWLERAIGLAPTGADAARAQALHQLGVLKEQQRKMDEARAVLTEALDSFRQLADESGEATCLNSLGVVARGQLDLDTAELLFKRSAEIRRAINDPRQSSSIGNLGIVALDRGEVERAIKLFHESRELDIAREDDWGIAVNNSNLGVAYLEAGEFTEALKLVREGLRGCFELEEYEGLAEALEAASGVASMTGDAVRAGRLFGAAQTLRRKLSIPMPAADRGRVERWLARSHSDIGRQRFEAAESEGAAMTLEQAVEYAVGRVGSAAELKS
jgi:predicted ATPase